jgi:hypothetical protein
MKKGQEQIDSYMEAMDLSKPVSPDVFKNAVFNTVKDRGLIFYFMWKTLKDMHSEIDADAVMAEASHRFGLHKSNNLGEVRDAKDAMLNQTSKAGLLAFEQEINELTPERAEKAIRQCPHMAAFDEVGCTKEEKTKLCTKLLMPGDFGLLEPFPEVELEFPKNLAENDVCIMVTRKAK